MPGSGQSHRAIARISLPDKADDLERQARVLREACALMNGDLSERKEKRAPGVIEQALALRREQRAGDTGGHGKDGRATQADTAARIELIRACLAEGSRKTNEVVEYLKAHGWVLSRDRVRQILQEMPDTQSVGNTFRARWQLKGEAAPSTAAKAVKPPRPKRKTPHKVVTAEDVRAQRALSAQLLEQFERGMVMTTADLHKAGYGTDAVRKLGGLFRHGYLKRKGEGWTRTAKVFTP